MLFSKNFDILNLVQSRNKIAIYIHFGWDRKVTRHLLKLPVKWGRLSNRSFCKDTNKVSLALM